MARGDVFSNRPAAPDRSERGASIALAALLTVVQIGGLMLAGTRLSRAPDPAPARPTDHSESITYIRDMGSLFTGSQAAPGRFTEPAAAAADPERMRDTAAGELVGENPAASSASSAVTTRDVRAPLATIFDRPCVGPACASARRITVPALPRRGAVVDRAFRDSVWRAFREDFPRLAAKQLPPTQEETDRMWRARSLAASEKVGPAQVPAMTAGVSIPVGLPFGGPSKQERERAAALHRDNTARLARIDSAGRARLDSLHRLGGPCRIALGTPAGADSTRSTLDLAAC